MIQEYLNYIQEEIKYNEDDLNPNHHGVSAIIYDKTKTKILMQDHVKFGCWTIPVGKVDKGDTPKEAIKREILEETGLKLINFKEVSTFSKTYLRDGIKVTVTAHIFEVYNYSGTPRNLEPKKHKQQIFMSINDVDKLKNTSDATKYALKHLKMKG